MRSSVGNRYEFFHEEGSREFENNDFTGDPSQDISGNAWMRQVRLEADHENRMEHLEEMSGEESKSRVNDTNESMNKQYFEADEMMMSKETDNMVIESQHSLHLQKMMQPNFDGTPTKGPPEKSSGSSDIQIMGSID